jgi:beta-glucosidase
VDVLFGKVNPAARLVYTIAKNESDYNGEICPCCQCNYTEGLFIDYRHFDQAKISPRFEFGYGLSYTTFNYSHASITMSNGAAANLTAAAGGKLIPGGPSQLFDTIATASVEVQNTGKTTGDEVVQLYVKYPAGSGEPPRQLRGFTRLHDIAPGNTATANFTLQRRDMSIWDVTSQKWTLLSGQYQVMFGKSSRHFEGGILNVTLNVM